MFITIKDSVINSDTISRIECSDYFESDKISLYFTSGKEVEASGIDALNIILKLAPSWLEVKQGKFARWSWGIHNTIGHPFMQICYWLGLYRLGLWFHDITVPRLKK